MNPDEVAPQRPLRKSASAVSAVVRRTPFRVGHSRFATSRIGNALLHRQRGLIWTHLRNGVPVLVDTTDGIGASVALGGDYDRKVVEVCERVVRPGDVAADLGANCGSVTLYLAKLVGAHGEVHAFEPQVDQIRLLRASLRRNGFGWVHLHEVAVSDHTGSALLTMSGDETWRQGQASLEPAPYSASRGRDPAQSLPTSTVPTVDARTVFTDLPRLRLLKLDIEGHEATVLERARPVLMDHRPECVVIEAHPDPGEVVLGDRRSLRTLEQLDMDLFTIRKNMFRLHLEPASLTSPHSNRSYDFVAIPRGPAGAEVRRRLGIGRGARRP